MLALLLLPLWQPKQAQQAPLLASDYELLTSDTDAEMMADLEFLSWLAEADEVEG